MKKGKKKSIAKERKNFNIKNDQTESDEEEYMPFERSSRSQRRLEDRILKTNPYAFLRGKKK